MAKRKQRKAIKTYKKKVDMSIFVYCWIVLLSVLVISMGVFSIKFIDMYPVPAYSELDCKNTVITSLEKRSTGRFAGHHYILTDTDGCVFNISGNYNEKTISDLLFPGTEVQIKWYSHGFLNKTYAEEIVIDNQTIVTYTNSNDSDRLFFQLLGWLMVTLGIAGLITYIVICKKQPIYYKK